MNIFVTGTDFGIGKTLVSAGLSAVMQSLGYNTGVYKPVQTNSIDEGSFLISPDLAFIKLVDPYITTHSTYLFKSPALPCIASEIEKTKIDIDKIITDYTLLARKCDTLIVEGTGSLMTPVTSELFSIDIAKKLNLPVVIVTKPDANSLSTVLLMVEKIKAEGMKLQGIIINKYPAGSLDSSVKAFPRLVEEYSDAKIIGVIREFKRDSIKASMLIDFVLNGVELEKTFSMKIPKLNI